MDLTSDRVGHQSFLIFFAHLCCLFRFFYPWPSMISLVSPHSFQPDPLGSLASRARKAGPWQPMAPFLGSIQRVHLEYKTKESYPCKHTLVEGRQNHHLGVFPQLLKTDLPQPGQKQPAALPVPSFPKSWGAIR